MNQFEEVFDTLNSLKEELRRLRRIEQNYLQLKQEYETLLNTINKDADASSTDTHQKFYFYLDEGRYTGYSVQNIKEFSEVFKKIPLQSIEFHLRREDFENWLNYIDYKDVAQKFSAARLSKRCGEVLKQHLTNLLSGITE